MLNSKGNQYRGKSHELHKQVKDAYIRRVKKPCDYRQTNNIDDLRKNVASTLETNIPEITERRVSGMSRAACHQLVTIDEAVFGVNIQLWQRPQMHELAAKRFRQKG